MDDNVVADLPFDSAPDRSETFVDANSDFDIDHIDSHQLIERSDETSSSATFTASSSSSGNPNIPDNEPVLSFLRVEERGGATSRVYSSPDGTIFWKPDVDPTFVPVLYSVYDSWEAVSDMYETYAAKAGFSTRLGTHKHSGDVTKHRYILCNRAGKPKQKPIDSSDKSSLSTMKTVRSSLTDCDACIRVKFDVETRQFVLYVFREAHNHELIGPDFMDFTKRRRKLDFSTQQFIHQMSLNKLGPNIAHRVQSSLKGGHHNVHGSTTDFKNFSRSIRLFIGNRDAKLVMDTLQARTENLHNFFYECLVVGTELKSFFWADDVSRCNYEVFGDVLSFDATYRTNVYRMIFVPFTGVDHHNKCVLFGAGMISDETIESYTWLLSTFLKAHLKQPVLVLTDQDSSMKAAVTSVFNESVHHLCAWHIMRKLPSKILGEILANTDLRKSIHKLVWNLHIDTETFEERWHELLAKYDLTDHEWLSQIYEIRSEWVPAFFRDVPMSRLMKTTSRSESSNAHFKVNSSLSNTLLQFLLCFDTALDWQRNNQRKMEFETNTTTPELHTPLPIERHAAAVYTSSLFKKVQKEIKFSLFYCPVGDTRTVGDTKIYIVSHNNKNFVTVNRYEVSFNVADQSVMCSCLLFPRIGYLCRHVYHVFRFYDTNRIPDRYINRRWTRNALPARVYAISNRYSVDNSETGILRNEIIDTVSQCIDHLRRQPEQLANFSNELKEIKRRIFLEVPRNPEQDRTSAIISDILRQPEFGSSSFVPTQGIRNKGCGTDKRLVGPGEKAVETYKKGPRFCKKCNKLVYGHDSRNHDKVIRAAELAAASSSSAAVTNACSSSGAFPNSDQVLDVPCVEPPNSSATRRQPFRAARRAPITDDGSPSTPPSF
ncbi:hypothetical protein SSX86_016400 [Deinandra increscens subsp. villosa]|uniref:SWIM-type domain-containing protein n=1 Tax=Deinandra increscens subsp. villosa TaxID=3103831 RepID=A0AAP0D2M2_9ASTR